MGYTLYGVSADTPGAHQALMEAESLGFDLLSDQQLSYYLEAGIIAGTDTGVKRGVVVYDSEGEEIFKEVTDDPAAALLDYLNI